MRNVKPKVDNEAPLLNVGVLYRPGVLESIAERLTQIEEQNFKLTKQINIIYRIRVNVIYSVIGISSLFNKIMDIHWVVFRLYVTYCNIYANYSRYFFLII